MTNALYSNLDGEIKIVNGDFSIDDAFEDEAYDCYQHAGYSRSESFFNAQKLYAPAILGHTDISTEDSC